MKCEYCKDKILKFQKTRTRVDRETEKEKVYHERCYERLLDELIEKMRE